MSAVSYSGRRNRKWVGVALESLLHLFPSKVIATSGFHIRFSGRHLHFRWLPDVRQCQRCHIRVGHYRKCGGSRCNRFAICFLTKVISNPVPFPVSWLPFGFPCRQMSGHVHNIISKSSTVELWVAVEIASPALSVQTLFPLPVSTFGSVADVLGFPMSANIGHADSCHF